MSDLSVPLKSPSSPSKDKVDFLSTLKILLCGGVVLDEGLLQQEMSTVLGELDDGVEKVPTPSKYARIVTTQDKELGLLRDIDDSALDLQLEKAEEALAEKPSDDGLLKKMQQADTERMETGNAMRQRYQAVVDALTEAVKAASHDGRPRRSWRSRGSWAPPRGISMPFAPDDAKRSSRRSSAASSEAWTLASRA